MINIARPNKPISATGRSLKKLVDEFIPIEADQWINFNASPYCVTFQMNQNPIPAKETAVTAAIWITDNLFDSVKKPMPFDALTNATNGASIHAS